MNIIFFIYYTFWSAVLCCFFVYFSWTKIFNTSLYWWRVRVTTKMKNNSWRNLKSILIGWTLAQFVHWNNMYKILGRNNESLSENFLKVQQFFALLFPIIVLFLWHIYLRLTDYVMKFWIFHLFFATAL